MKRKNTLGFAQLPILVIGLAVIGLISTLSAISSSQNIAKKATLSDDGPGGCCGPNYVDNCRSWEACDIPNGACGAGGRSCRDAGTGGQCGGAQFQCSCSAQGSTTCIGIKKYSCGNDCCYHEVLNDTSCQPRPTNTQAPQPASPTPAGQNPILPSSAPVVEGCSVGSTRVPVGTTGIGPCNIMENEQENNCPSGTNCTCTCQRVGSNQYLWRATGGASCCTTPAGSEPITTLTPIPGVSSSPTTTPVLSPSPGTPPSPTQEPHDCNYKCRGLNGGGLGECLSSNPNYLCEGPECYKFINSANSPECGANLCYCFKHYSNSSSAAACVRDCRGPQPSLPPQPTPTTQAGTSANCTGNETECENGHAKHCVLGEWRDNGPNTCASGPCSPTGGERCVDGFTQVCAGDYWLILQVETCTPQNIPTPTTQPHGSPTLVPIGGRCNYNSECVDAGNRGCNRTGGVCQGYKCIEHFCDVRECFDSDGSSPRGNQLHACMEGLHTTGSNLCCPTSVSNCQTYCQTRNLTPTPTPTTQPHGSPTLVPYGWNCTADDQCVDAGRYGCGTTGGVCYQSTCFKYYCDVTECSNGLNVTGSEIHTCKDSLHMIAGSNLCCPFTEPNCQTYCETRNLTPTPTIQPQSSTPPIQSSAPSAPAQPSEGGTILVVTMQGSIISNGTIILTDSSGKKYKTKTDSSGNAAISAKVNENYKVTFSAPGYKDLTINWTPTSANKNYLANIKMEKNASPVQGYFEIKEVNRSILINAGWNLLTLPLAPTGKMTAKNLLEQINSNGGEAYTLSKWEDSRWETYSLNITSNDFVLEPGKAYFVQAIKDSVWQPTGQDFAQPLILDLKPGWNAIGLPKTTCQAGVNCNAAEVLTKTNGKIFSRFDFGLWDSFARENNEVYGNNFSLENFRGYFLKTNQSAKLSP